MAEYTENYSLIKPDGGAEGDFYNVEDFNRNANIIDAELKNLDEKKASLVDGKVVLEQIPELNYDPSGTATQRVNTHNLSETAHVDIRSELSNVKQIAQTAAQDAANAADAAEEALKVITDLTYTIDVVPTQGGSLTYTGNAQVPTWNNYDTATMTISGTTTGTNAGTYTAQFTPKEGYKWADGTTSAKSVSWVIRRAVIVISPSQSGTITYTGGAQSPSWVNYDTVRMTIGGTTSATNAGSYSATFTPTANYMWSDDTTAAKNVTWSIARAAGSSVISPASLTLTSSELSKNITVTRSGDGVVSATSSNTAIATVSVSGTIVTVTAKESGTATITVKVAQGTNHNAPSDKTCSVSVQLSVIYGVSIDLSNSNPKTAVTYTDSAVGMTPGSAWNSMPIFKDIKPCMLKNGVVQYYLNPANLAQKADGTAADITSGNDGDVMIEIPKTGFRITTSGDTLTIKITDNPNDTANFKYYAHTRAAEGDRSKLYIGAYLGSNVSSKLRSLSGKTPTGNKTIGQFRTLAQANGTGYDQVSFYPLTLLQCLFLIKYKNRDSQTALGRGHVDLYSAPIATGGTNAKGIDFGETTGKRQMCFLNIEDMWGNLWWLIDGFFYGASRNMLTAFTGFNDTGSGYTNRGQGATADIGNYMSKPQGTTEAGFVAKEVSGSATTHFTDYAYLSASHVPGFGGGRSIDGGAGVFSLGVSRAANDSSGGYGARLMYL